MHSLEIFVLFLLIYYLITKSHSNLIARSNSAPAGLISLITLFFGISFSPTQGDQESAKSGLGDVSDNDKPLL